MRQALGCGVPLVVDSSLWCSLGSFPARSAAAALPRSLLLDAGYLRLWLIAVRAAMPILHCARDQVTCAARAWQRGSSMCRQERGTAALVHGNAACRCI